MEKLKKVLLSSGLLTMLFENLSFATDTAGTTQTFDVTKIILLLIAVVLIVAVLYASYKTDSPSEAKTKVEKKSNKKDKLKDELVEKDNTYEVEENEFYEDDKIEPVSIGKDEDEISLFESVNNPDTEREEKSYKSAIKEEIVDEDGAESFGFMTKSKKEENNEVKKSNRDMFDKVPKYNEDDDTVNDFFSMDDEIVSDENAEIDNFGLNEVDKPEMESADVTEDNDEFNYNYDDIEKEINSSNNKEGTMVFNSAELNSKINIFAEADDEDESESENENEEEYKYDYNFEDKKDSKEEVKSELDIFANVKEEPTEFAGFTTLKPKAKTRGGNSRFDRPSYEREENIAVEEKEEEGNSANDFLAQMERNLGGESNTEKKVVAKKTATKKTTAAKKVAEKNVATKKTDAAKSKVNKK